MVDANLQTLPDIVVTINCTRCSVPKRNVGHLDKIFKNHYFVSKEEYDDLMKEMIIASRTS